MTISAQPGVYLIRNPRTGKTYVGSSDDMADRCRRHLRLLKAGKHHSFKLQKDFNRYGAESFEFKMLLICAVNDLLFFEQRALVAFDAVRAGYNVAPEAGAPMRGRKHTPGTKAKMSGASKGRKKTPEHAKAIGDAKKGKPLSTKNRLGIKKSWETRRLVPVSDETRRRLSEAGQGRAVTEKSRQALITRNKARAGEQRGHLTLTPEGLEGRIAANKARKGTPQRAEIKEDLKKAKQAAWAARKAAGLHTRRWYSNRGLPVPGETQTSETYNDGVASPALPPQE